MKVLMIEPEKTAYVAEIGDSRKDIQQVVGEMIEVVYPYEERVALVCNDEGKIDGMPLNRGLRDKDGNIYDIIAGTFFICGLSEDNFASLTQEQIEKYDKEFHDPEVFIRTKDKIIAFKVSERDRDTQNKSHEQRGHDR